MVILVLKFKIMNQKMNYAVKNKKDKFSLNSIISQICMIMYPFSLDDKKL